MFSLSAPDRHTCYWRSAYFIRASTFCSGARLLDGGWWMSINAANAAIVGATSCVGAAPPAADALAATMARRAVAAVYAAALNRITLLVI